MWLGTRLVFSSDHKATNADNNITKGSGLENASKIQILEVPSLPTSALSSREGGGKGKVPSPSINQHS